MNKGKGVVDYGEPWRFGGSGIVDRNEGDPTLRVGSSMAVYNRAAECVNACQGVSGLKPGAVRELVRLLYECINSDPADDERCTDSDPLCDCAWCTETRAALAGIDIPKNEARGRSPSPATDVRKES